MAILLVLLTVAAYGASAEDISNLLHKNTNLAQSLKSNDFSDEEIQKIFSDNRIMLYPEILEKRGHGIDYMSKRFGLLTRTSVKRGKRVLSENRAIFKEIENKYGVEKEAVVAIYRLETNLGGYSGKYLVFNGLFTLAVLENRRSAWAEKELLNLLIFCKKNNRDPFSIYGSWAGAFGLCQFMPSSVLKYAVDGDGDGNVDLNNFSDAMSSIANYLKSNGWERGNLRRKKQAVWAYNHCDHYVKAVFAYANACKKFKK